MKFEIFSGKFQNAVNVLEYYGYGMHNEDIMYMMWIKLQIADLSMFMLSLKIDYIHNVENYTKILQYIATQIPTTKIQPFSPTGVSELNMIERHGSNRFGIYCPAF